MSETKIYPYEPPRQLATNLWQIRGSLAVPVPRNMTIYRVPDGRLVLYSVVAMHEPDMRALEALGEPAFMVMPHVRHQMDAPFYKSRYPRLRVLAPDPSRVNGVIVDGSLAELEQYGIRAYEIPGSTAHDVVLELPITDGVAVSVCELLTHMEGVHGVMALLMKAFGPPGGEFGVARAVRWREVDDRAAVRAWMREVSEREDLKMVLMGHGEPLMRDARAQLRHAAQQA